MVRGSLLATRQPNLQPRRLSATVLILALVLLGASTRPVAAQGIGTGELGESTAGPDTADHQTSTFLAGNTPNGAGFILDVHLGNLESREPVPLPAWLMDCEWDTKSKQEHWSWLAAWDGFTAETIDNGDEEWVVVTCPRGTDSGDELANILIDFNGLVGAWPSADTPPVVISSYLVYRALGKVEAPVDVGISSPPGNEDIPMITQLDTWLWLSDDDLRVREASDQILNYSATVRLTPVDATFEGGQVGGHTESITCTLDEMVAYNFNKHGNSQDTDCKIFYRFTEGDNFITTTVRFVASYSCNTTAICTPGTLGDVYATSTRPVVVNQWLALNRATETQD